MQNDFYELYKHPLWQKKRLEIMELAGFACHRCGSKSKTLNVHHKSYEKGKKPWEYENDWLRCLCDDCHVEIHGKIRNIQHGFNDLNLVHEGLLLNVLYSFIVCSNSERQKQAAIAEEA